MHDMNTPFRPLTRNDLIARDLREFVMSWEEADGDQVYEYEDAAEILIKLKEILRDTTTRQNIAA